MAQPAMKPNTLKPVAKATPAPKPASPIDIMNAFGDAADKKSRMINNPADQEDSLNSDAPKANGAKSPASTKGKQVAAMKAKQGTVGAKIPNTNT